LSHQAAQFAQDHPVLTTVMVTGAAVAVAPQVVTGTALSAAGFGPGGIVASQFNPSVPPFPFCTPNQNHFRHHICSEPTGLRIGLLTVPIPPW
jgi:hypothetical protein